MNEYAIAMDNEIKKSLKSKLNKLEELFESDVIFFMAIFILCRKFFIEI